MKETSWTKEETLYIYAYLFKYPFASDETIAHYLLIDGWISEEKKDSLTERIAYLREHRDLSFHEK